MNWTFVVLVVVSLSQDVWSKKHGVEHDGKIVGGTNVSSIDLYPYQAYLALKKGSNYPGCGGSIINSRAILTAAHCLVGVERVYIRIGSIDSLSGGSVYQSSNFIIHPLYTSRPHDYDIAVIRLSEAMKLDGKSTKAVALPQQNTAIPAGTIFRVSGWGDTSENGTTSRFLMTVDVPAISNEQCSKKLSIFCITPRMVCAGEESGGKDSCQGDSGGPAVDKDSKVLLGVVSFGLGCARPGLPGVYVNVPVLVSWIHSNAGA